MPVTNPLLADPTRTATLRRQFCSDMTARFAVFRRRLIALIAEEDAFGLKEGKPLSLNVADPTANIAEPHDFSSTHALLPTYASDLIKIYQEGIAPEDVQKIEDEFHITSLYGLHTNDFREIENLVRGFGEITVKFGKPSLFRNEESDVLMIEVESSQLHWLNHLLRLLPHTSTFNDYKPHATVAYLKPGTGDVYLDELTGLEGMRVTFEELVFSDKEHNQTKISLVGQPELIVNSRWSFRTSVEQLNLFRAWIDSQTSALFFSGQKDATDATWWKRYVVDGFVKGAGRAFDQLRGHVTGSIRDFHKGTRYEFLRSAFAQPETVEKVQLLASRVFTDLKGVTDTMSSQLSRNLVEGLSQGKNPRTIAAEMVKTVDKMEKQRALVIARTEIIRAHASGQLVAMKQMGVERVGVMVEWAVARDRQGNPDERVCPLCYPLNGIVLTLQEAEGLLPRHPLCRCMYTPAQVGEKSAIEKRDQPSILRAIDTSIAGEISAKARKRGVTLKEQKAKSKWGGADAKISKVRPKSILDD